MVFEVDKVWPNPGVLECPHGLQDAINLDPKIGAYCEEVLVEDGIYITITFDQPLKGYEDSPSSGSPDENQALDDILLGFDCDQFIDPAEEEGGLLVKNDNVLLVPNVESFNYEGAVSAVQFDDPDGTTVSEDGTPNIPYQADILIGTLEARNDTNEVIPNNTPVYIRGYDPVTRQLLVGIADASDPDRMPAIGLTQFGDMGPRLIGSPAVPDLSASPAPTSPIADPNGYVIISGESRDCDTSGAVENDPIYVNAGGGISLTKPVGEDTLIQVIARVSYVDANEGRVLIFGVGRTNDTPNLPLNYVFVGDITGRPTVIPLTEATENLVALNDLKDVDLSGSPSGSTVQEGDVLTFVCSSPPIWSNRPPETVGIATKAFKTIITDSGTTEADRPDDTLNIVGGTGIAVSASTTGSPQNINTVTITNTSGAAATQLVDINGQLVLVYCDTTRPLGSPIMGSPIQAKMLSVADHPITFSENRLGNRDWIQIGNATDSDSGYIADLDGTIVYATGHCENTGVNGKEIHVYINGTDVGPIGILYGGANVDFINTTENIDFNQGDRIRLRAFNTTGSPSPGTGPIEDTVVKLTLKWRK